ncbi:MAG TPA: helix-turn-helix domain-containing protein [Thermodesulfobacteriota bacterium]|nr:helix-turn-helix domain-containing protein [Thermodesulfobacteriota bacterium]
MSLINFSGSLVAQQCINLTPLEAAEYLNFHVRTIYRSARSEELPARKIGGRWRFRKDVLDKWLALKENTSVKGTR